jgi:hypothetical protein
MIYGKWFAAVVLCAGMLPAIGHCHTEGTGCKQALFLDLLPVRTGIFGRQNTENSHVRVLF